jgi:hypothetical protein
MIKKIKRKFSKWLKPYNNSNFSFKHYTECNTNYSLVDKIIELENRIIKLEDENLSLTNELYRLENSLESRIDLITSECKFKTEFN